MRTRVVALVVALLLMHVLSGVAGACSWVVIHPDPYIGPPGFWALWHALTHRNVWVVIAAFDNAKSCAERAKQESDRGGRRLAEETPKTVTRKNLEEITWASVQAQARCMPLALAEKIATLRVSDLVR